MSHSFLIWLLAVSHKLSTGLCLFGMAGGFISLFTLVGGLDLCLESRERADFLSAAKYGLGISLPALLLGLLIPCRSALVESYLIVEGSSLVTAENASEVANGVLERVDKIVDHLTKD